MEILSLLFWKKVWNWCKVNWKFLVGFAVPCIILYFFNQRKAQKILKKGIQFRKDQLDVAQRAAALESAGVKRNAEEFATRVEGVIGKHVEALRDLDRRSQDRRSELGGADATQVTEELAERFNLKNGDKK